jgi:predicted AAA+ superfamily ATPase
VDFGLEELPEQPGLIVVRGPRQYGKSTWIEDQLAKTIENHGPGSAAYINGDYLADAGELERNINELVALLAPRSPVRRLFIDEVTAIERWQVAFKRLVDEGRLRDVLVVTTGSRATDLRRGAERLPGRRGRLSRTNYLFTPVSFAEFERRCGTELGDDVLDAYLLAGGCPLALVEVASTGRIPEYVPAMIRDWIYGECAASGRQRSSLVAVLEALLRYGGAPVGQAKLAREAGLANNTVAAGYVELLADLMVLGISRAWDPQRRVAVARKPAKFHFINLLAAVSWDRAQLRSVADFRNLPPTRQGVWYEWLIAQELWRRSAIAGEEMPEQLLHWRSKEHELDFVASPGHYLEVKRGRASPVEFDWFERALQNGTVTVLSQDRFDARRIVGRTLREFLRAG